MRMTTWWIHMTGHCQWLHPSNILIHQVAFLRVLAWVLALSFKQKGSTIAGNSGNSSYYISGRGSVVFSLNERKLLKTQSGLHYSKFQFSPCHFKCRPLSFPRLHQLVQAVSLVHQLHFVSGRMLRKWGQPGYWSSECLRAKGHMRLLVASSWRKDCKGLSDKFTKTYMIWHLTLDYDIHPNGWRAKQPFAFQRSTSSIT